MYPKDLGRLHASRQHNFLKPCGDIVASWHTIAQVMVETQFLDGEIVSHKLDNCQPWYAT